MAWFVLLNNVENYMKTGFVVMKVQNFLTCRIFLASRRYDIAKIVMSTDARMARKLNSGTFDVKQYAEHPPVIHLCDDLIE